VSNSEEESPHPAKPGDSPSDKRKAWRIRKKGSEASTAELEWLQGYVENVAARSPNRPRGPRKPQDASQQESAESQESASEPDISPSTPEESPETESMPPPPPPPRVKMSTTSAESDGGSSSRKWQAKYSGASGDGREHTCVQIADGVLALLHAMNEQVRSAGIQPHINVADLRAAMIVTVDDLLPKDLTIKPQHIVIGGSAIVLTQRFMHRKKIAEVGRTYQEQQEYERAAQAARDRAAAANRATKPDVQDTGPTAGVGDVPASDTSSRATVDIANPSGDKDRMATGAQDNTPVEPSEVTSPVVVW
jgi:hypothetical protein